MYGQSNDPGAPGSKPLPNGGNPGTAFALRQKMHPAAMAAGNAAPRNNPLNQVANSTIVAPAGAGHR